MFSDRKTELKETAVILLEKHLWTRCVFSVKYKSECREKNIDENGNNGRIDTEIAA